MTIPVVDPNLVYIGFVLGMWIGITAMFIPGTGIGEALSGLALLGSGIAMLALPTNWLAVFFLVVGLVAFIVLPFFDEKYGLIAPGGLIIQGIAGYFMFTDHSVSVFVIGLTLLIPWGYHNYILMPMLKKMREHSHETIDRNELVVGTRGKVVKALDPVGTVRANGELWSATSSEMLEPGTSVVVVEREGLQLLVEPLKRKNEDDD